METYTYLREYPNQEKQDIDKLVISSLEKLPYTLSLPIKRLAKHVESEDYGKAMNHALDFFEITVQYVSCLLIILIQREEEKDPVKHQELLKAIKKIDSKRPLSFGDWVNDIFIPLSKAANDKVPNNRLVVSLNEHLYGKGWNLLTGGKIKGEKDPSIVQIRNEYRGHSTTLSEDIYKGVVYTLEPRIFKMLKALAPLQEWIYLSCCEQTGTNKYRVNFLNGYRLDKQETIESTYSLQPFHYYINQSQTQNNTEDLLDMFPLILSNENNYIYVFHTLKDEDISYISSNEYAKTYTCDCWNEAFDKCLQKSLPAFDISKDLNWNEVQKLAEISSRKFIEHAYKEKKYHRELFVDRAKLSLLFEMFQKSNKNFFPLLGEAGQGKTNQLCYWTEKLIEKENAILIFNSSGFSGYTLEAKLKNIFGFSPRKAIGKLLDNIHKKASDNNEYIYFFFDAINECLNYKDGDDGAEGPLHLFKDIKSLLIKKDYPRFKILFTCRNYTWKNLLQTHLPADDPFTFHAENENEIAVHGFTYDELEKAYEIYRELYQMNTPFPALSKSAAIRLKDPLVLKIACTNYLGMELPSTIHSYTSISLFEKMLCDIKRSYAGNKQCCIVKELACYILEEYEKGNPTDSISITELRKAFHGKDSRLHAMSKLVYKKDDITVAYGELLNKPERPILRLVENDNGEGQLQFIYERFLEFMLALAFIEREVNKLPDKKKNIPPTVFIQALRNSNTNVVFIGSMKNAIIIDFLRTRDLSVIIELVSVYGNDFEIVSLVTEVINALIQENYEEEVFILINRLLCEQIPNGVQLTEKFNMVNKKIESNQADDDIIGEHNRLYNELAPLIRLRKLASVSTINGIFLTDYFNEDLYKEDPFGLLWKLLVDPINDVRNDACQYIYYLSNKVHTLDYSLLKENLTQKIIRKMYSIIRKTPIATMIFKQQTRQQAIIFMETATRLCTLLIIDAALANNELSKKQIDSLLNEIKTVFRHFTANFYLLKIMMPFFQIILRRQITFQSIYVNNAIEYQTFWDCNIIPLKSEEKDEWSRQSLKEILIFVFHYFRYYKDGPFIENKNDIPDFANFHNKILSAYKKGDSFSYFALERILVIMGTCSWEYIRPIVKAFFTDEYRRNQWFDYSQMSMLYILFQVTVNSPDTNEEILSIYGRECEAWTRRCKGLFKAHNSHKANPTKQYKRNIMNWYCVVYCRHIGDAALRKEDERPVPVLFKLLDEAIVQKDKELLYHLIENISELISDYGYILTALDLLKYIFIQLDSEEKVKKFDEIKLERGGIYQDNIITLIGKVLGTAKNYFPTEVDNFLKKDIIGLRFPGVPKYRAEILIYNPSGESLSDLFTHKFGNFLMWALLNEEAVDKFAHEAMSVSVDSSDCFKWFDQVIRILFKDLFKVKL